ncbi:MAG: DUF1800 family protein, partial [Burkholderiales bacterium]|nr:DUF1800 family protein [Burkholderiales bacterium]
MATLLLMAGGNALGATAAAVEFYNTQLKHYFITAYPEEAAGIDQGTAGPGWVRTGGRFTVQTDASQGGSAVCRFYGTPGKGPNSHFYTADAAECAAVKLDPGWTYEAIAFYLPQTVAGACPDGTYTVYRSYNNGYVRGDSNHRFTVDLTAHVRMTRQGHALEGAVMCAPVADAEREADVVRLLEQASLGPTEALVQEVKAKGIPQWIDEQIALNLTRYTQLPWFDPPQDTALCINDNTPPVTPEKYCQMNLYSPVPVAREFFTQSKTAPDQLRMRMAHVWHQIFVLNAANLGQAYAHAEFQQRLRDRVFSSFENLLVKYAISPQLGHFQNWVGNRPEHDGIRPNENFARELMQLFTIGVNELNDDGSPRTDASGQLIPTYGPADISTFARVLTGFGFPTQPGRTQSFNAPWYFIGDMIGYDGPK